MNDFFIISPFQRYCIYERRLIKCAINLTKANSSVFNWGGGDLLYGRGICRAQQAGCMAVTCFASSGILASPGPPHPGIIIPPGTIILASLADAPSSH